MRAGVMCQGAPLLELFAANIALEAPLARVEPSVFHKMMLSLK